MKQKVILSLILIGVTSLNFIGCINNDKNINQNEEQQENVSIETSKTDQTDIAEKDSNSDGKASKNDKLTNNKEKDKVVKQNKNNTKTTQERKTTPKSKNKIVIDVKNVDKNSTFPFGMSKENVMIKLKELKLEEKGEIEITSSEDDPELGNKLLLTDCINFSFDKNNQLCRIAVIEKIPTSLGLKKGDSLEKIEKLYGKNYNKYNSEKGFIYEYTFNKHYFRVFVEDDKTSLWCVSKYKLLQ